MFLVEVYFKDHLSRFSLENITSDFSTLQVILKNPFFFFFFQKHFLG